ncbi:MAG: substrate-binding domain-containing protein [Nitrosopumilaceae archaeon]
MKTKLVSAFAVVLFMMTGANSAVARDQISIVGSSTVFPFATTVAEKFGQSHKWKSPVIESTGSGGGIKMFCAGIGTNTPDITNASRAIKEKEVAMCAENNITPIEYLIGYDGITISNAKDGVDYKLTKEEIYKAVAEKVWNVEHKMFMDNEYTHWNQINPALPNKKIDIMIPPTTSGTRDAFVELIMHDVCRKVYGMEKKVAKKNCTSVRTKGMYVVQMTENDNLIIEKLVDDKDRLGVFGFSFLDQNPDKVKAAIVDGVYPTADTIADGSYKVSRPLFFYVKKEHIGVIPGIEEYVKLFMSDNMIGKDGVLFEQGLIPVQK